MWSYVYYTYRLRVHDNINVHNEWAHVQAESAETDRQERVVHGRRPRHEWEIKL